MPYESQVILKVTRKNRQKQTRKLWEKGQLNDLLSQNKYYFLLYVLHTVYEEKILLPEKKDQGQNIAESSETDPNKTDDILKLGVG